MLVPAPESVSLNKTILRNPGSGTYGAEYTISMNGFLLARKGNPESSGIDPVVEWSEDSVYSTFSPDDDPVNSSIESSGLLTAVIRKQEALRFALASGDAILLEINGYNIGSGIHAVCDLESISFDDQTRWTNGCGYQIELKTHRFSKSAMGFFGDNGTEDNFSYYISSADESWSIQERDDYTATTGNAEDQKKIYTISHSISAVGQRIYEADGSVSPSGTAIAQASGYIFNVIGLGSERLRDNFMGLPSGLSTFNRKITEDINAWAGSYSVSEEFALAPSGQLATESINISIDHDLGSLVRVSINGTITGWSTSGITAREVDKYANAETYWQSVSGLIHERTSNYLDNGCLNTVPTSRSIGKNLTEGIITYNYSYDNRPANSITGALTEDIQISDTYPGQIINVVPVIGRSQPIIQYLNSRSEYRRGLQITATMPIGDDCLTQKPATSDLEAIFNLYKPVGTRVYYGAPQENWNPKTGQYSYAIEWTFEKNPE